jgi:hypothetical protein
MVEGYDLPMFSGCHALVELRDSPGKSVEVLTDQAGLEGLLTTALATGNLIAFWGSPTTQLPPRGGTWSVDVYAIDGLIVYGSK